jgi:hypothetical protein
LKALFIVFTAVNVLRMAHVHIREGVADWYWTADRGHNSSVGGCPTASTLLLSTPMLSHIRFIHEGKVVN